MDHPIVSGISDAEKFHNELNSLCRRWASESYFSYAELIGVLESEKTYWTLQALGQVTEELDDEGDEEGEDGDDDSFWR